jgi:hypothetical protein
MVPSLKGLAVLSHAHPALKRWAKLSRAYLHPSSRKNGANRGPRLRRWIFGSQTSLANTKFGSRTER